MGKSATAQIPTRQHPLKLALANNNNLKKGDTMKQKLALGLLLCTSIAFAGPTKSATKRIVANDDSCAKNAKEIAEHLALINDRNPDPQKTTVTFANKIYSVVTVSANATRIGNFSIKISNQEACVIKSVTDDND